MNAAKKEAMHILELLLPEGASLEDIQYYLIYVRQEIEHGLADVEAERTFSEERV